MKYINNNYWDFKDATVQALKYKISNNPIVSKYLDDIQRLQTKIDKFKEIKNIGAPEVQTEE